MPIQFVCPSCGHQTLVADQFAGQSGPCSHCGQTITIPGVAQPGVASPQPVAKKSSAGLILAIAAGAAVVLFCIIGVLIALLLPAVQAAREAARRTQAQNNVRQICIALMSYHDVNGHFPPAYIADKDGRPMHSWRVLILPYMEEQSLYDQYDMEEPWDGPNNSRLTQQMPRTYRHPSRSDPGDGSTDFFLITGMGAVFDGDRKPTMAEISDGLSNTLMVVESSGSNINWMEPRDLDIQTLTLSKDGIPGQDLVGASPLVVIVGFGDGSVRAMPYNTSPDELHALMTKDGQETVYPSF